MGGIVPTSVARAFWPGDPCSLPAYDFQVTLIVSSVGSPGFQGTLIVSNRVCVSIASPGFHVTNIVSSVGSSGFQVTNIVSSVASPGFQVTNIVSSVGSPGFQVTVIVSRRVCLLDRLVFKIDFINLHAQNQLNNQSVPVPFGQQLSAVAERPASLLNV